MVSPVQEKLLNYADEHLLSYYEAWQRSSMAFTRSTASLKRTGVEAINSQLQQYGVELQLLSGDHPLLYRERCTDAFSTLLFYYAYDMAVSPIQQAEAFAACVAALDIYQRVNRVDLCLAR
ncbi:MAG TPA: hypothetical protein VFA10_19000 [Ktedonobacteraceae bacterium]|nr:hypothetical protein [Ktedonobacteraceae bacterium]